jgi:hypothetical protein
LLSSTNNTRSTCQECLVYAEREILIFLYFEQQDGCDFDNRESDGKYDLTASR